MVVFVFLLLVSSLSCIASLQNEKAVVENNQYIYTHKIAHILRNPNYQHKDRSHSFGFNDIDVKDDQSKDRSSKSGASFSPENKKKNQIFTSEYKARKYGFYSNMIDVENYQHKDRPRGFDFDNIDVHSNQNKDGLDRSDLDVIAIENNQSKDGSSVSSLNVTVIENHQHNGGLDGSKGNRFYLHNPYSITKTTIHFLKNK